MHYYSPFISVPMHLGGPYWVIAYWGLVVSTSYKSKYYISLNRTNGPIWWHNILIIKSFFNFFFLFSIFCALHSHQSKTLLYKCVIVLLPNSWKYLKWYLFFFLYITFTDGLIIIMFLVHKLIYYICIFLFF